MRVQINDNSIKHNVYKMDNYEDGIIVKPFRFHESDTANKNTKNSSHQALNNDRNHMYNNSQKHHTNQRYRSWRPRDERLSNNNQKNTYNNCLHPDYRQPQMIPSQHHNQPQQFSRPECRHSSTTPSHSTNYSYSPATQQIGHNNYHRPEVTNVLPYPAAEYNNDSTTQMLPYPINNNIVCPSNSHRF